MAWHAICAERYLYFTAETLKRVLDITGFQVHWIVETGSLGRDEAGGKRSDAIASFRRV